MRLLAAVFFVFMLASPSWAQVAESVDVGSPVRLAFIEMRRPNGDIVQLEPGGRFVHIAISYGGQWLQSSYTTGVAFVGRETLEQMGTVIEIEWPNAKLNSKQIKNFLGRPYDLNFSWDDSSFYCSELVGKLLRLKPTPMYFDPRLWPESYSRLNGQLGMSPDDIFTLASSRSP